MFEVCKFVCSRFVDSVWMYDGCIIVKMDENCVIFIIEDDFEKLKMCLEYYYDECNLIIFIFVIERD